MTYDVIIVGGNFAGLSAALQLGRVRRTTLVIDAGEPRNRFAVESHGFLGQDGVPPFEIKRRAEEQLRQYPSVALQRGRVEEARSLKSGFEVRLETGEIYNARKLLLATGVKDELPAISGLAERWGASVLHCPYCHGYEVRDQRLGVLATMPYSAQTALLLPDLGPTTFFSQGHFEPDPDLRLQFEARKIALETVPVVEAMGAGSDLEAVRLADGRIFPIQALFIATRVAIAGNLPEQLGCAFDAGPAGPIIRVDQGLQTTIAGVFAAGDTANQMHSATFASASGVLAAVSIHRSLVTDQATRAA